MSEFAVEMRGISKSFGGIRALDHVSFAVRGGEVHALLGENGAGKSTLMKILSGAYRRDDGEIRIGGKEVEIGNPHVSRELGIGIIYQELVLAPDLSVAENIFLGELPGFIPWKELQERSRTILKKIGFDLDPKTRLGDLPVAYQQVVEIEGALEGREDPDPGRANGGARTARGEKPSRAGQDAKQSRGQRDLHLAPT